MRLHLQQRWWHAIGVDVGRGVGAGVHRHEQRRGGGSHVDRRRPRARPAPGAGAAPGATFKAGQTATVGFDTTTKAGKPGPSYKINVNVESITKGSLADFNGIKLDANEKASTPYYVKVKITSLGPGKMTTTDNDPAISVEGVDSTGQTQQSVTFFGDFPKCDEAQTPNPLAVGKSFETCLTFLVPGGIRKVAYTGTESYITKPVTWSP